MPVQRMITTEEAVAQLRAYARYIDSHAEVIVGDIDNPNYVTDGGIRLSFNLALWDRVPVLRVNKEYVVHDAHEDGDEREAKAGATRVVTAWDEWGRCVCSECGLRVDTSDAFCRHCGVEFLDTKSTYVDNAVKGGHQE